MDDITQLAALIWGLAAGLGSFTFFALSVILRVSGEHAAASYVLGLSAVLAIWELSAELKGK